MAGAVAETGAAEEAAAILRKTDHAIAIVISRDAPMRVTRCRGWDLPRKLQYEPAIPREPPAAQPINTSA